MHKGFGVKEILTECQRLDEVGMDYNFFYLAGIYGSGHMEDGVKNTAEEKPRQAVFGFGWKRKYRAERFKRTQKADVILILKKGRVGATGDTALDEKIRGASE